MFISFIMNSSRNKKTLLFLCLTQNNFFTTTLKNKNLAKMSFNVGTNAEAFVWLIIHMYNANQIICKGNISKLHNRKRQKCFKTFLEGRKKCVSDKRAKNNREFLPYICSPCHTFLLLPETTGMSE